MQEFLVYLKLAAAAVLLPALMASCAVSGSGGKGRAAESPVAESASPLSRPVNAYAGSVRCRECHPGLYEHWRGTGHAESVRTLAATGEEQDPSCLRCHATGFGSLTGYGGTAEAAGLAGVGCEACHGPSADHAGSAYPGVVPSGWDGSCQGCEVSRVCRRCHTGRHSPGFVLSRALAEAACSSAPPTPVPAAGEE